MYRLPVPLSPARPTLRRTKRALSVAPARSPARVCVRKLWRHLWLFDQSGTGAVFSSLFPFPSPTCVRVQKPSDSVQRAPPGAAVTAVRFYARGSRRKLFSAVFIRVEVKRTANVCKTTRSKMGVRSRIMRDTTKFAGINPQWNVLLIIHERAEGRICDRGGRPTDSKTIFFFQTRVLFFKTVDVLCVS